MPAYAGVRGEEGECFMRGDEEAVTEIGARF